MADGSYFTEDDFDEDDVWAVVKEKKESSREIRKPRDSPLSPVCRHLPSAARMIPRTHNPLPEGAAVKPFLQSAPVSIPDWSKIYGKNGSWVDHGSDSDHPYNEEEEEEEESEEGLVPPHEWLARKLARSQISSFSVCEGAGRTLKGRDLSKVRNAVLTRTGFLE